jgi:hypothetical protein
MSHPQHHAESSARKYGGEASDYIAVHNWFDATKAHIATPAHRAIRHHSLGVFDAEAIFGLTLTNSAGRVIPTRWIGEQHLREECGCIPTVADWLKDLPIAPWMVRSQILGEEGPVGLTQAAWREAVANQQTELGYRDWYAQMATV